MSTTHKMYSDVEANTEVMSATPHRQVELLMEKCLRQMETAKFCILNKNYSKKQQSILNAIEILNYLRLCLNFKNPEARPLSEQLESLYRFMTNNLMQGNLHNNAELIEQAHNTLAVIYSGWAGMENKK